MPDLEMMRNFNVIEAKTTGPVHIKANSQYNNIQADTVVLHENITARLYGSIQTSVTLKKGSKLYLHGSLAGTVENEGGEIFIY